MTTSIQSPETKNVSMTAIVDRSGSMGGYKKEAIKGMINIIEEQGEVLKHLRLVMFSTTCETVYDSMIDPLPDGQLMTYEKLEEYFVTEGSTAMYDAMNIGLRQAQDTSADINIVLFLTDGHENASVETTFEQIKTEIQKAQENKIVIISLGVSKYTARDLGLDTEKCIEFSNTTHGMTNVMRAASDVMRSYTNDYEEGRVFTEEHRLNSSQVIHTTVSTPVFRNGQRPMDMGASVMDMGASAMDMGASAMDFDSIDNRSMQSHLSSSPI